MHLLGARTDEDVQEQLTAKREMPQWDSEEDEAAEKEVSMRIQRYKVVLASGGQLCSWIVANESCWLARTVQHAGCLEKSGGPGWLSG